MEKWKLLIIDDDKAALLVLRKAFSKSGFKVFAADNLEKAEKIFRERGINCVLVDYRLGAKTACDFCASLRTDPKTRKIPIAVLSGYGKAMIDSYERCAADLFMDKDKSIDEIVAAFGGLLRRISWERGSFEKYGVRIDYKSMRIYKDGKFVNELSPEQFALFSYLLERSPDYVSKEELFSELSCEFPSESSLYMRFNRLKAKIGSLSQNIKCSKNRGWAYIGD